MQKEDMDGSLIQCVDQSPFYSIAHVQILVFRSFWVVPTECELFSCHAELLRQFVKLCVMKVDVGYWMKFPRGLSNL